MKRPIEEYGWVKISADNTQKHYVKKNECEIMFLERGSVYINTEFGQIIEFEEFEAMYEKAKQIKEEL